MDLLSMSGHKIYGPKGIGAIYIRKVTKITSQMIGGHHEMNKRAGTENVAGIVSKTGLITGSEHICAFVWNTEPLRIVNAQPDTNETSAPMRSSVFGWTDREVVTPSSAPANGKLSAPIPFSYNQSRSARAASAATAPRARNKKPRVLRVGSWRTSSASFSQHATRMWVNDNG